MNVPRDLSLLDHVPNGCFVVDETGKLVFWNAVLEAWTGVPRDAVVGRVLYEAFPQLDKPRYRSRIEVTLSLGAPSLLSAMLTPPFFPRAVADRRRRFEQVTVTRLAAREGTAREAMVTIIDATEQYERGERFHQESRRANAEAAMRRSHEAELLIAKDAAESATRAKSLFLASMSHELRTPMNGVLGLADALLQSELTAWQREHIDILQTSARSLLTVLNDILDFSKIEAEKLEIEAIPFDARGVVEDCVVLVAELAHAKGLECLAIVSSSVPRRVVGDPVRFRQVVLNLLSNAIKFTVSGEVVVELHASIEEAGGVRLRCDVRDTGDGMPSETCAKLFEPFTQAAATTTRTHGGTGLGLSICRRLVRLMGGDIVVDSELGRGSVFRFDIRAAVAPSQPELAPAPRPLRVGIAISHGASAAALRAQVESIGASVVLLEANELHLATSSLSYLITDHATVMHAAIDPRAFPEVRVILVTRPASSRGAVPPHYHALLGVPGRLSSVEQVLGVGDGAAKRTAAKPAAIAMRVLLAEDDRTNQIVARAMLKSLGCTIDIVADGRAAVDAALASTYDLVLMDMQMPVMDGCEATTSLRRAGYAGPILALTASVLPQEQGACLAAGMDEVLTKPLERGTLREALERWYAGADAA